MFAHSHARIPLHMLRLANRNKAHADPPARPSVYAKREGEGKARGGTAQAKGRGERAYPRTPSVALKRRGARGAPRPGGGVLSYPSYTPFLCEGWWQPERCLWKGAIDVGPPGGNRGACRSSAPPNWAQPASRRCWAWHSGRKERA
jgi:hypothetical protein